ncbi:hypothetical protein HELRODRAFT_193435 [Helobdella robusta]|uniref:SERRATE/Ars2 N-terminal domain-containing protein n=1 Tax=Helobdella robusta TaxID=6412 RepID=T1FUZ4_HELRO|nr:hypothetical protein HELRODRAFT_193435 [Helobdella robusta]ESN95930.1 hypothetical protein HELRODRAFT_193435 [Helobdella robusta]
MADEFSRDHMREKFRVEQKSVGEKAGLHLPWQSSARLPWLARPGFSQRFQNHVYRPDVTGASAAASATGVGGAGASAPFAKKFKRDWTTSAPQHPSPAIPPSPRQNKDNSNISSSSSSIKSPVTSSSSSSSHTSSSSTAAHAATTQASSSNVANSSSIKSSSSGSIGSGSIGSGSLTFRRRTFTFEEFAALNSGDKTLTEADLRLKYERHKFQRKYHPNEYQKRLEEKLSTVKRRRKVFERLMEMEMVDPIVLEVNRANNIVKALDRMILYLRVVHSFDYYVSSEYTSEDIMPHVCVNEWMSGLDKKLSTYMNEGMYIPDDLYAKFFSNNDDDDCDDYDDNGSDNDVVLDLDLDPTLRSASSSKPIPLNWPRINGSVLSVGRRADFVSKHIRTKHTDKLDIIKTEMMPRYPSFSVSLASQAPFRPPHPPPPPPHHYHPFYRAPMTANYNSRSHGQDDTYRPRDRYVPRRGRGYYRAGSNM